MNLRDALAHGATPEQRALIHAITKADGDRERAIRNVLRLCGVKALDALPARVKSVVGDALP